MFNQRSVELVAGNSNLPDEQASSKQQSGENAEPIPLGLPFCECMSSCENCLFNNCLCAYFLAFTIYLPIMLVLYILFIIQIPLTIIFNLLLKLFCDCKCFCQRIENKKKNSANYCLPKERLVHDINNNDMIAVQPKVDASKSNVKRSMSLKVTLHRGKSLVDVGGGNDIDNDDDAATEANTKQNTAAASGGAESKQNENNNNDNNNNNKLVSAAEQAKADTSSDFEHGMNESEPRDSADRDYFRVLQFNVFSFYGKYWNRYGLITSILNYYKPEIICIEEAIPSHIFPIGTLNTIYKMNNKKNGIKYYGYFKSIYDSVKIEFPIIMKNSYILQFITELHLFLNAIFIISTLKKWFWKWALRSGVACSFCFYSFTGAAFGIANAIAFKNTPCYYRDMIVLRPGMRSCVRSLYVTAKKDKKIWVFTTHLTAQTEKTYENRPISVTSIQVTRILNWIHETQTKICHGHGIIICGDFNATPESDAYQLMLKNGFKSVIFSKYGKEIATYPSGSFTYSVLVEEQRGDETLDYIWYKGNINFENAQIMGKKWLDFVDSKKTAQKLYPSDHYGIMARFSI